MNRIKKYTFLLIIVCGLVGCGSKAKCGTPNMSSSSSEYLQFVDQALAADANCSPPCWQGLTPGEATKEDVLARLTEIPFVNQEHIVQQEDLLNEEFSLIRWVNTVPQPPPKSVSADATINSENLLISIQFTGGFDYPLRSFGTVTETFGEPDFYLVVPGHNYACKWDRILWLDEGIEIMTYPELAGEDGPAINEDTPIGDIVYFIPQQSVESYLRDIVGLSESGIQERLPQYRQWAGGNEAEGSPNDQ
ncbi:MAG: hypothetical protein JXJ17_18715 [Anaerolineae bacterium]|nr:hypothetical protein [Anaerolineae bacterium]